MMTGTRRPYLIFCPLQGEWWGKWRPSGALTRTCRKQAVRRCRSERKQRDLALKNTQNGPRAAGCTERYRTGQLGGAVPWWVCRLWSPIAWRCRLLSKNKPAATKKKKKNTQITEIRLELKIWLVIHLNRGKYLQCHHCGYQGQPLEDDKKCLDLRSSVVNFKESLPEDAICM